MSDIFSREKRSWLMSRVKAKDTLPEIKVRSMLHLMGYRFRLYRKDLPGRPDIVLPRFKKVIFVHGCFWHGHSCKKGQHLPETRTDYWRDEINKNTVRDQDVLEKLKAIGWQPLVLWECEIKDENVLKSTISSFLC